MLGVSVWGPHGDGVDYFYASVDRAIEHLGPEAPWDFFCDSHRAHVGDHDFRSVARGVRWAAANRERLERDTRASAMYSASSPQSRKNERRGPN